MGKARDVKAVYRNASVLRGGRLAFNLRGDTYRLVVAARYDLAIVYVRFIGTHSEYDDISADSV